MAYKDMPLYFEDAAVLLRLYEVHYKLDLQAAFQKLISDISLTRETSFKKSDVDKLGRAVSATYFNWKRKVAI